MKHHLKHHPLLSAVSKHLSTFAKAMRSVFPFILAALAVTLLVNSQPRLVYSFFQSPVDTPEATATSLPTDTPAPAEPANAAAPTPLPVPTNTPRPEAPPPELPPPPAPVEGAQTTETQPPLPPEDSGVVINEVKLIDTIVQWFAWLWLCAGVGIILLVPIIFLFLQLRGSRLSRWR